MLPSMDRTLVKMSGFRRVLLRRRLNAELMFCGFLFIAAFKILFYLTAPLNITWKGKPSKKFLGFGKIVVLITKMLRRLNHYENQNDNNSFKNVRKIYLIKIKCLSERQVDCRARKVFGKTSDSTGRSSAVYWEHCIKSERKESPRYP